MLAGGAWMGAMQLEHCWWSIAMAQQLLIAIPTLCSIVAISCAVCFLTTLALGEYEKFNEENEHGK